VFGDAYTVLPFGNNVALISISASLLWIMLENSVSQFPLYQGRYPQISGFTFSYNATAPVGARVLKVTSDMGESILRTGTEVYSMATIDYILGGGDGYTMFKGVSPNLQDLAADSLIKSIKAGGSLTSVSPSYSRITPSLNTQGQGQFYLYPFSY
jgi:5'-nucleotidase